MVYAPLKLFWSTYLTSPCDEVSIAIFDFPMAQITNWRNFGTSSTTNKLGPNSFRNRLRSILFCPFDMASVTDWLVSILKQTSCVAGKSVRPPRCTIGPTNLCSIHCPEGSEENWSLTDLMSTGWPIFVAPSHASPRASSAPSYRRHSSTGVKRSFSDVIVCECHLALENLSNALG